MAARSAGSLSSGDTGDVEVRKTTQVVYVLRDLLYTLALGIFGWVLADFGGFIAFPLPAVGSFFKDFWNLFFVSLLLFAFGVELVFCPGRIRPSDEVRIPWRRWKGMLMEANLVPAIFCARLDVLQISRADTIRIIGIFFLAVSMVVTVFYGVVRSRQIKESGEDSFSTRGIYRYIRYPEYLAQLLYSLFVALFFRSCVGLIVTLLLVRSLVIKTGKLDRSLDQKYLDGWMKYCQTSKRLIPFLI